MNLKDCEEKEFRHRKQKADKEWIVLLERLSLKQIIPREEIICAMDACNMADGALLKKGYKLDK